MTLSKKDISEIKASLDQLVTQLQQDILEAKKGAQPVVLDQQAVGRISRVDAIQQQQMQAATVRRMEQKLAQSRAALGRVDNEFFGLCSFCEEPIEMKRLKIRPESPLCLICARKGDTGR